MCPDFRNRKCAIQIRSLIFSTRSVLGYTRGGDNRLNTMADDGAEEESERRFENNPGKKVRKKDDEVVGVYNADVRNAIYLRFVESLAERVEALAKSIQDDLDQDSNTPLDIPLGSVGITGSPDPNAAEETFAVLQDEVTELSAVN